MNQKFIFSISKKLSWPFTNVGRFVSYKIFSLKNSLRHAALLMYLFPISVFSLNSIHEDTLKIKNENTASYIYIVEGTVVKNFDEINVKHFSKRSNASVVKHKIKSSLKKLKISKVHVALNNIPPGKYINNTNFQFVFNNEGFTTITSQNNDGKGKTLVYKSVSEEHWDSDFYLKLKINTVNYKEKFNLLSGSITIRPPPLFT
ncbi:hypothetical protein ABID34_004274 [Chryseobacterium limigenitum]